MSLPKGYKHSEETKAKISAKLIGRLVTSETIQKRKETRLERYPDGYKFSPESKRKHKATWAKKRAEGYIHPNTGKKLSEEHRKNLSRAQSGSNNPRYGKEVLKETREAISRKNTGKKRTPEQIAKMSGPNNWNWNPDRELVAKNDCVRRQIIKYLGRPINQRVTDDLLLEKLKYSKKSYIISFEGKFTDGMSWQNNGVGEGFWQAHHKIPIPWFFEFGVYSIRIINALSNLQPAWFLDHWEEHRNLNGFTKEWRRFWVELFTYHVEQSSRKPLDLSAYEWA